MRKAAPIARSLVLVLLLPVLLAAAQKKVPPARSSQPAPKKQPAKPAVSQTAKPKSSSSASKKQTATQSKTAARRRPARRAPVARGQSQPTKERYAEIQTALAQAGYFHQPANGKWEKSSVAALTQFQRDSGLEPTGKIDALSLIKLGLGPNYTETAEARSSQ